MAVTHGHTRRRYKSPTYQSWANMIDRCQNPRATKYPKYGARGITVYAAWQDFRVFLADMGERPEGMTLDRRENSGNYEPGNCRWATRSQQQNNRGPISRKLSLEQQNWVQRLARRGVTHRTLARFLGVSHSTVTRVVHDVRSI